MDIQARDAFRTQYAKSGIVQMVRECMASHGAIANDAELMFSDWWNNGAPPRVPGVDTVMRLACKAAAGRDASESAASEWLYRWNLALDSLQQNIEFGYTGLGWPAPDLLGQ